ncbi:MAG TPA: DUF2017 family protein [Acidimicrobiia bacterium]|jgi:hypothetical protein|nr:DUF2017 family protein [Acidimicrobiia bacterium]
MARAMFRRARGGALVVTLHTQEVELLVMTARDMIAIVEEPPDGDVRDRLYPRAYLDPTEEKAQGEYDALVHGDLVQARRAALAAVADGLEGAAPNSKGLVEVNLTPEEESQWLTALNDARLVIGTALGVTEETDTDYAPGDPRYEYGVLYSWLTQLHFELVELLLDEIGETGSDDPGVIDPSS